MATGDFCNSEWAIAAAGFLLEQLVRIDPEEARATLGEVAEIEGADVVAILLKAVLGLGNTDPPYKRPKQ